MRKSYSEKLKDPRWQRKRLEVLHRDDFSCQKCGETKETLHVHHRRYIQGHEPWEYSDRDLVTLCELCHETETEIWPEALGIIEDVVRELWWADGVCEIASALHASGYIENSEAVPHMLYIMFQTAYGEKMRAVYWELMRERAEREKQEIQK